MAKGSRRRPNKPVGNPKSKRAKGGAKTVHRDEGGFGIDDEVDTFHKQRELIPLDVNADSGGETDEDEEQAVLNLEDSEASDSEDDDRSGDDDDGDNDKVSNKLPPLAAKIARQAKFLQQRMGGTADDIHDDESEEEKKTAWGRHKGLYFGADNADFELLSSDEELLAEEDEALRIQKEKAKQLSMEDFDLDDAENAESDHGKGTKSLQDIFPTKMGTENSYTGMPIDETTENFVTIKKDLGALSKEEQMEVVYSCAPELVGLLSELNDTLRQLKTVELLQQKLKDQNPIAEGVHYLEVKQRVLLVYCQAIAFYLLLKSEGNSVRDHPVVSRLVEIKNLLEKVKVIDAYVPSQIESADYGRDQKSVNAESTKSEGDILLQEPLVDNMEELVKVGVLKDYGLANTNIDKTTQVQQLGLQSKEMLKLRAALEEKMKQKGVYGQRKARSNQSRNQTTSLVNKRMESLADFDDEVADPAKRQSVRNGLSLMQTTKLSQLVAKKGNKPMMASGDNDLPQRDDIGERRRKHELRVLSRAGVGSMDDDGGDAEQIPIANRNSADEDSDEMESEDEFYKEVKRKRAAKVSARAELQSRVQADSLPLPQDEADGKRLITYQIEKNRGLTRSRKKLTKNPRKKYKLKHQKAVVRRKGQVRDIRKPSGPYGGEATGISVGVSHSVRFK